MAARPAPSGSSVSSRPAPCGVTSAVTVTHPAPCRVTCSVAASPAPVVEGRRMRTQDRGVTRLSQRKSESDGQRDCTQQVSHFTTSCYDWSFSPFSRWSKTAKRLACVPVGAVIRCPNICVLYRLPPGVRTIGLHREFDFSCNTGTVGRSKRCAV